MVEDYSGWHWQNDDPYVGILKLAEKGMRASKDVY